MSKFKRIDVLVKMREQGLLPLLYHPDAEVVKLVLKACYKGGIRIFEFTNRGDFAHEVFAELSKWRLSELPGMILGVGSVYDASTSGLYIQLGADFIVSPVLSEEMARACNRRKIAWLPGCATASEISRAEELGAEVIKVFPGSTVGGAAFVKSILGPSPWSHIMPSGGVSPTEENLKAWFDAGAYCVGMGSKLITSEIIKNKDYEKLTKTCEDTLELIRKIRNNN